MIVFVIGPIAFLVYFFGLRYFLRSFPYRWAVWLWALTFVFQLPFFYQWEWAEYLLCFLFDPFNTWTDTWRHKPLAAVLLLVMPSVPAFIAFKVRNSTPAPPSPPRPWVVPTLVFGFLTSLMLLFWWLVKG
jgi:hypothetical protein